jgi:hypothetical protein
MFTHFYHHQLQRYLIAFGAFFNNISIHREDNTGKEVQRLTVPLEYGPKEAWLARLVQDPDFKKGVSLIVPRMSFEMTSIAYDSARHLNSLNNLTYRTTDQKNMARLYVAVPYTLHFNLDILVKLQQDGLQIVEQILPYFTPDLTFRLQPIPALGLTDQIPLTLVSTTQTDNYEGDFIHRRAIVWTLGFTMKVNFYGPIKSQGVIDEVLIDIYNSPLNDIIDPPITLETEDNQLMELEDGSGHLVNEATPNTYLTQVATIAIDTIAAPNQDPVPGPNVISTTTVTENL